MLINWINGIEAAIGGSSAASIEQGALAYLMVSLLGPLSWMFVVEICRRARASRDERKPLSAGDAAARLAMPIARLTKPPSGGDW